MNYSQRKYIERLLAGVPSEHNDPLGIWPSSLCGMRVIESRDQPRYVLPEELMPGVPWPPGFRDSINAWSREFLGTTNLVPRGHAFVLGGSHVVMRSEDVVKISNLGA